MPRPIRTLMLTATLVAAPAIAVAQSPAEIVGRMMERYSESTANIDMGAPPGQGMTATASRRKAGAGRLLRTRHNLLVEQDVMATIVVCGTNIGPPSTSSLTMQPSRAVFLIDRDRLVMLRMEMDAEIVTESGEPRTVHIQSTFSDYRDVEGMLHPFLTSIAMEGMMDAIGGGDPDELRSQLEEMERQLESMTGPGRDMAERMMGPQIERLRDMLGGAPMEIRVTSIRANVDPPGD